MGEAAVTLNGQSVRPAAPPSTPLLHWLRNDCGLNGPKYGCGLGECGACTVLVDGRPARSCTLQLRTVAGRELTTLEGLGAAEALHPVQQAFVDAQAAQCGYCLNGMVMTTAALLRAEPQADEARIRQALSHNLCRCGTHVEILRAALLAAERLRPR